MALQFNPPEWLIQEYMARKNGPQRATEFLSQVAGIADQQSTNALRMAQLKNTQQESVMKRASIAKDYAGAVSELGPEQAKEIYDPTYKLMGMESPVLSAWNSQSDSNLEKEFTADPLAFEQKYGSKRANRFRQALQTRQTLEANQPLTSDQYAALQSGTPEALGKQFPSGIPRQLAGSALMAQSRNVQIRTDPITGEQVRIPVPGAPGVVNVPGRDLSPLQKKLTPVEYKDWQKEVNDFDADPVVKETRVALGKIVNVEQMLSNYNPSLTGPIKSQQARAIAQEVGALTDSDIARQSLDPSWLGRLKSLVSVGATGELPPDQLDLLKQSIQAIKAGASAKIRQTAQERASRKANLYGGKVSVDDLIPSLNIPTNISGFSVGTQPSGAQPTQAAGASWDDAREARYQELLRKRGGQ